MMKRHFLTDDRLILLAVAILFSIGLLTTIAPHVSSDKPLSTSIEFGGESSVDQVGFIDPFQYTSKNLNRYKPRPVRFFRSANNDPLWMNFYVNVERPGTVTAVYRLIGAVTHEWPIDFDLPEGGNWRLSAGWPEGVPSQLKGRWTLEGEVIIQGVTYVCPQPWTFIVR